MKNKNRANGWSSEAAGDLMTAAERENVHAFRRAIRAYTRKAVSSQATAMQALIDAGLYTVHGKPKKQFR